MKALVIGAAGFVGGYLLKQLRDTGYTTYATKLPSEKIDFDTEVFDLDITDGSAVFELISSLRPEKIFHLAAQSSVMLSWEKPELTINVNVFGALNLLEACKRLREEYSPAVLMIGSGEEYGKVALKGRPIPEDSPCAPGNIYALTKQTQNGLARIYATAYKMNIINVRAFNHTGAGQSTAFVISDFCSQVAAIEAGKQEPIISVGNLNVKRDFTDVHDIVNAYVMLCEKGEAGQTYNVGSGKAMKLSSILDIIISKAKCPIEVRKDPDRMRPADVPIQYADISKIKAATGWKPQIPIEQTVEDCLNYFRALHANK